MSHPSIATPVKAESNGGTSDDEPRSARFRAGNNLTKVFDPSCDYCIEKGAAVCTFDMAKRRRGTSCDLCYEKHRPCSARDQVVRAREDDEAGIEARLHKKRRSMQPDVEMDVYEDDTPFRRKVNRSQIHATEPRATRSASAARNREGSSQSASSEGGANRSEKVRAMQGGQTSSCSTSLSHKTGIHASSPLPPVAISSSAPSGSNAPGSSVSEPRGTSTPQTKRRARPNVADRAGANRFKAFLMEVSKRLIDAKELAATAPDDYERKAKIFKHEFMAIESRMRAEAAHLNIKLPRSRDANRSAPKSN